jgi:hypothetical protein
MRTICARFATWTRPSLSAIGLTLVLALLPSAADAIQIPTFSLGRTDCVNVAGVCWHTNYENARREAKAGKKMLLVNFIADGGSNYQRSFEKYLHENEAVRKQLDDFVLVRVSENERPGMLRLGVLRKSRSRLLDDPAYRYMSKTPGVAIVDFKHTNTDYSGRVVTALPFKNGKYYRWTNSQLAVALDLPAGTITQRTMVWAVRIHPEHPRSTNGKMHPELAEGARKQSAYQAQIGVQGHHNWESRIHHLVSSTRAGGASEVVAESWPNQGMIDSCIDCVLSWRHSPGHWGAVSRNQRYYGYDIRQGGNGIWYGTGIFAN